MAKIYYLSAKDVAQILNVSLSTAYKVIKDGNKRLSDASYQTLPGRIPAPMLEKMYFGLNLSDGEGDDVHACV